MRPAPPAGPPPCALTIDVDGLDLYARLHGLPASVAGPQAWTRGVRRFLDLLGGRGVRATFFVVGGDVARPGHARDLLQEAVRRGHEVGNHTLTHPYDLAGLPAAEQLREVRGGADAIEGACGVRPAGFRAPGYAGAPGLLRLVAQAGHSYDSSLLPCPAYVLAKWAAMAALRVRGRTTAAVAGSLRPALLGPRGLHRPAEAQGLVEAPISTTARLRVPLLGTTLLHLPPAWLRGALPGLRRGLPLVNVGMHAVDLVGVREDGVAPALHVRPEPGRLTLEEKSARLLAALDILQAHHRLLPLGEAIAQAETA